MEIKDREKLIELNYQGALIALSNMVHHAYEVGIRTDTRLHEAMKLVIDWHNDERNFFFDLKNKSQL